MPQVIDCFDGQYRWLSNFIGGAEQEYQAAKTVPGDPMRLQILAATPGQAKRMGKKVVMRPDWDQIKLAVMTQCLRKKFRLSVARILRDSPSNRVALALIATGDTVLIEGNEWHDNFWGNCTCERCKNKFGKNWLGRLLMLRRSELVLEQSTNAMLGE